LDARLAPAGEAEQDDDESAAQAALAWLADSGRDLDHDDDNDGEEESIPSGCYHSILHPLVPIYCRSAESS
jgi:hypothetical protein